MDNVNLTIRSPFDESLPDDPNIDNLHYMHTNIYKVRQDLWDWFNISGHGSINHAFGGDLHFYTDQAPSTDKQQIRDIVMWTIINVLWYVDDYTKK